MSDSLRNILFDPTVSRLIMVLVGIVIVIALVRFANRSIGRHIRDTDNRYRVRKFVTFLGYLAAVIVVATVYSNRLGGLTVAFGVAGAGVAFALQEVIASVAGWFAVTFASFFKPGDRVQLGGIKGDVIDIGVLRTTLMEVGEWVTGDLYSGRVVRVANSFVFKEPVFNYSGDFPFLWDEISIPVKYGSDRAVAQELITRVGQEEVGAYVPEAQEAWKVLVRRYLIEDASVEPMVTLTANDNWMTYTLRYVVDYKGRRGLKHRLFSRILEEIEATGGKVALASTTFELVGAPRLDVQVRGGGEDQE